MLGGQPGVLLLNATNTSGTNASTSGFVLFDTPPAGTEATLTITFDDNVSIGSAVVIISLDGLQDGTPKDTDTDINGSTAILSLSVEPGDVIFGAQFGRSDANPEWIGIDEEAERIVPGSGTGSWGFLTMTTNDPAFSITGDMNSDATNCGCALVLR